MRLYIPKLKDELTLSKDWTFDVHAESRNTSLMTLIEGREIGYYDINAHWDYRTNTYTYHGLAAEYPKPFSVPAGTVLRVERIYIRQNAEQFDSITFRVMSSPDNKLIKARFWVKLDDANTLEFDGRDLPVD